MQSKTSYFNGTIFRKNILHFWPVWSIYLAFLIFCLPIYLYIGLASLTKYYTSFTEEELQLEKVRTYMSIVQANLSPYFCAIIGLIAAMAVFYYLYNVKSAHAFHSFPVSRKELFITNYCSGILFFTIPQLIAFLLSVFVGALMGITSLEYLLYWFLMMEGMSFFFYNMAILIGMFCGQFFALPVLFVLANYLYVGFRYLLTLILATVGYGLSDNYANWSNSFLSPLAFLGAKVGAYYESDGTLSAFGGGKYIACYALIGIVFGILSFLLYRKRKIENTGDVLSVKWVKPVVRWGFATGVSMLLTIIFIFSIAQLFIKGNPFWSIILSILVLGIVSFFLGEMILERKTKVFSKKRILECGIFSVVMMVLLIGMECDVLGLEKKQPQLSDIESAYISMYYPIYADDEDGIQEILDIHKQVIDSKSEFETFQYTNGDYNESYQYVSVRYLLKDGTQLRRSYTIPANEEYLSDSASVAAKLTKLSCDPENYIRGNLCINYNDVESLTVSLDVYNERFESRTIEIDSKYYDELFEALKADISAGALLRNYYNYEAVDENNDIYYNNSLSFEMSGKDLKSVDGEFYGSEYDSYNYWYDDWYAGITLNKKCTHLLEFLQENGVINDTDSMLLTDKEYSKMYDGIEEN